MALQDALERVSRDEERGDLGKARDRLEGLVAGYPDSLEVRRRLGDVYWRLQYPERAGLHWYLLESSGPEMDEAKSAFESHHGEDPWRILDAIGYHGGLDSVEGTYAGAVVGDLAKRAGVSHAQLEAASRRRNPGEPATPVESRRVQVVTGAVLALVVVILALAAIGLIATISTIRGCVAP